MCSDTGRSEALTGGYQGSSHYMRSLLITSSLDWSERRRQQMMRRTAAAAAIGALLLILCSFTMISRADAAIVSGSDGGFPVSVTLRVRNNVSAGKGSLQLDVTAIGDAPLPEGYQNGGWSESVRPGEEPDPVSIRFEHPGSYRYRISMIRTDVSAGEPAASDIIGAYTAEVDILSNGYANMLIYDEEGAKTEGIVFSDEADADAVSETAAAVASKTAAAVASKTGPGAVRAGRPRTGDALSIVSLAALASSFALSAVLLAIAIKKRREKHVRL